MWLLLKGGRIIDPASGIDKIGDLLIVDGRIAAVGKVAEPNKNTDGMESGETCDVSGMVVTPGLIDMHVHLREPGFEYKETIATGANAAAAGGFTAIAPMPNTKPAIDNRAMVEFILSTAALEADIRILPVGAMTKGMDGKEMAEIGEMVASGVTAVSDDAFPIQNSELMRRLMEYCKMFDLPILTHCEDKNLVVDGMMNEGAVSTVLGLRGMPAAAEEIMIARNIALAELAGSRLHIQHVSSAGSVEIIRQAKKRGVNVTCETCPQYFSLTDEAVCGYNTNAKVNPPLRTAADVEAIKQGLAEGVIDAIATDHAPHAIEEKEVEFNAAAFGMVGLETALPLTITNLVETGVLSLSDAIAKLTANPASILKVEGGNLKEGSYADVTIFDPKAEFTVKASELKSKSKNTPFDGMTLKGSAVATICYGKVVYGQEKLIGAGKV
ncbi:MAG: dihydroorotase [Armatimonadota bacterium]|nr:dihydroorotase [Armatimonadota bacterium]